MRAIRRAHPSGLIDRCRRKAMGPREEQSARVLRAEAKSERQKQNRFALAVALDFAGPVSRGEVRPEPPDRVARRMRASSRMGRKPIERTPA